MLVLAADTSGKSLSIALCQEDIPLVETNLNLGYKHSITFQPLLEDVILRSEREKQEIDLFAATVGPGSFTGIRIGLSALKTMAWALNRPVVGVSTLEVLAAAFRGNLVLSVLDARGGRVFSSLFQVEDTPKAKIEAQNRQAKDLWQEIKGLDLEQEKIVIVGDGLPAMKEALPTDYRSDNLIWTTPELWTARASVLARLARIKYLAGDLGDPFQLLPEYLSLSQAERMKNINTKKI